MWRRWILEAFFCTCLPGILFAQQACEGMVLHAETGEPLEFVNVGVPGAGVGTVTDAEGRFALRLSKDLQNDTLRFSMVGFEAVNRPVKGIQQACVKGRPIRIALQETGIALEEVEIKSGPLKEKTLGNTTTAQRILCGFRSNELGTELGVPIHIKKSPTYIRKVRLSIGRNPFDTLVLRLNMYRLEDDTPTVKIFHDNILMYTTKNTGVLTLDLTPYNIVVEENFLLAVEWVRDLGDVSELQFSGSLLFNKGMFFRSTSHDNWARVPPSIAIALSVDVAY